MFLAVQVPGVSRASSAVGQAGVSRQPGAVTAPQTAQTTQMRAAAVSNTLSHTLTHSVLISKAVVRVNADVMDMSGSCLKLIRDEMT